MDELEKIKAEFQWCNPAIHLESSLYDTVISLMWFDSQYKEEPAIASFVIANGIIKATISLRGKILIPVYFGKNIGAAIAQVKSEVHQIFKSVARSKIKV